MVQHDSPAREGSDEPLEPPLDLPLGGGGGGGGGGCIIGWMYEVC